MEKETLKKELETIREICKDKNFSEESLMQRARLLFFFNKLDFWKEMPILLGFLEHEKKSFKKGYSSQEVKEFMVKVLNKMMPNQKEIGDLSWDATQEEQFDWAKTNERNYQAQIYLNALMDVDKIDKSFDAFIAAIGVIPKR